MNIRAIVEAQNPWWRERHARAARKYPFRRRLQHRVLRQVLRIEDRRAVVLMGPRQVGKTVLLRQTVDDLLDDGWPPLNILYFDFSDVRLTREVPVHEIAELQGLGLHPDYPRVVLLDEVSYAPRWDRWLKQAVDRESGRLVVTDSAATVVRQAGRESGVGRWDEHWLEGLTLSEFLGLQRRLGILRDSGRGDLLSDALAFIPQYLDLGGFPEHATSTNVADALSRLRDQVVAQAVLRDLGGRVRDPEQVRKLFVYLIRESGGLWNESHRASDLGSDRRAVGQWLQLIEDTLLVVRLKRFVDKAAAGLRAQPKLYSADHGLVNAFALGDSSQPEVRARVYEAVVFRHLRELVREDARSTLSYYRDRTGREVDFVLDLPGERVLIEVTGSRQVKRQKRERLGAVARKVGADRRIIVFGGNLAEEREEVRITPLGSFLLDPQEAVSG